MCSQWWIVALRITMSATPEGELQVMRVGQEYLIASCASLLQSACGDVDANQNLRLDSKRRKDVAGAASDLYDDFVRHISQSRGPTVLERRITMDVIKIALHPIRVAEISPMNFDSFR